MRQQLAASLGALPAGPRETALASLLERHGDDPIVMDAALSGVRGSEAAVLEKLLSRSAAEPRAATGRPPSATAPQREAAITMVARDDRSRRAGRRRFRACSRRWPTRAGRAWQRVGAAARRRGRACSGAAMPGHAGRPREAGRRLPAARAVSDVSGRTRRSGRRVRVSAGAATAPARPRRAVLRLSREPRALSAIAAGRRRDGDAREPPRARAASSGRASPARRRRSPPLTRRRAAALRRRAGGLQEHLPGLPSAGRPRPGPARADAHRLDAGARAAPRSRRASCSTARKGPSG